MRSTMYLWALLVFSGPVMAEGIGEVLSRSQQDRLASLPAAPMADSSQLRGDFERVKAVLRINDPTITLEVVSAGAVAETIEGRTVVLHQSIGQWTEPERLFVIAHELGHVAAGHWGQLAAVYQRHIPGTVTPETTSGPVAALLGREASRTSHQHEFESDAYALAAVQRFGYGADDVISVFRRLGGTGDTATHPGIGKRVAQLRALSVQSTPASATR